MSTIPTRIGRYQVLAELGRGGFGRVYRAFDPSVGRPVAIKVLTEGDADVLTRFRNEASVVGNLQHKNIVTVYEYGEHEERPFLVMEYLEGEDLHGIIARRSLGLLEKCNIMSQVAEGLDCAHSNGIVHRDVKPANIMVLGDGTVKILDFGIAKVTQSQRTTRLTQKGQVVGTVLYMAPEQLSGADSDVLSDIFSYGVVYYELLTGKHPFEAADTRTLMYKLMFEEARPIQGLAPECPEALAQVVMRLLSKNRELRYHSLKDVQFDTEPVRIEVQQERAAKLLVEAQELFDRKELDPAEKMLREVLSLDPANRPARHLRESVQKQLHVQTLRPRIEALARAGEDHALHQRFPEAAESFQEALRLDSGNVEIQGRLEQVRSLLAQKKKAEALVAEAKKQYDRQDLASAYKSVSEALLLDPDNKEAAEWRKLIQELVDRRERERKVDEAITKVEGLLVMGAFDQAIALLTESEECAKSAKAQHILQWVRNEKAAQERRSRLKDELAAATGLVRERRFQQAVERLERLSAEFPDNKDVSRLLAYARKELAAEERAGEVERLASKAQRLVEAKKFGPALAVLDEALQRYPGEGMLIRLLANTMSARSVWEREAAIGAALRQCEELRAQKRFAEAMQVAEAALRDHGAEPAVVAIEQQIEQEWKQQKRREAIDKAVANAEALLSQGRPDQALQFLKQASSQYPGEKEWGPLVGRAEQAQRAREQAEAIAQTANEARFLARQHSFSDALLAVKSALEKWPGDPTLVSLQQEVLRERAGWERQQAIQEVVRKSEQLAQETRFQEALELIADALQRYPGEPRLLELGPRLERDWQRWKRAEAVSRAAAEGTALIGESRLEEAVASLREACARYAGETALDTLLTRAEQELAARQQKERAVQEAEARIAGNRLEDAVDLLKEALARFPGDAALEALLSEAGRQLELQRHSEEIERVSDEARRLVDQHKADRALALVNRSLEKYAGEPALLDVREYVDSARQQEEALRETLARLKTLDHEKRFEEGLKQAEAALAELGDEPRLRSLRDGFRLHMIMTDAERLLDEGRPAEALRLLEECVRSPVSDPGLVTLVNRAREEVSAAEREAAIEKVCQKARARHEARDFSGALAIIEQGLREWPGEVRLLELEQTAIAEQAEWRRQQQVEGAASQCALLENEGRLDEALQVVQEVLKEFPGEPKLLAIQERVLAELREAESRRLREHALDQLRQLEQEAASASAPARPEEIFERTQKLTARYPVDAEVGSAAAELLRQLSDIQTAQRELAAGHFGKALEIAGTYLARQPEHASFLPIKREAEAGRERAELEDLRKRSDAEPDLDRRAGMLEEALTVHPGDAWIRERLEEIGRLRAARERKRRTGGLLDEAKAARGEGRYEDCRTRLREAFGLAEGDTAFRKLVLDELAAAAEDAVVSDWRQAEALAREMPALEPGYVAPGNLLDTIARRKKEEAVEATLSRTGERSRAGDPRGALAELERALGEYPGQADLERERETIEARLRQELEQILGHLGRLREAGQAAGETGAVQLLLREAWAIAAAHREDPAVGSAVEGTIRELQSRLSDLKRQQLFKRFAAYRMRIAVAAASVVVAVAGWYAVRAMLGTPLTAALEISSTPAGASIQIGSQVCNTPKCEFKLKRGEYTLQVRLDGYRPVSQSVTIDSTTRRSLQVAMQALPLAVQVSTNFASGQVYVDGKQAGNLQDGQFTLRDMPFGKHELSIRSSDAEAKLSFSAAPGQLPGLSGPVEAKGTDAVVVSNLGRTAKVSCNSPNESLVLDGKTMGTIGAAGLELHNLEARSSELKVGSRSLVVGIRPEPTVNIFLTSNRDVGMLVVETNVPDAEVLINNRVHPNRSGQKLLRIPLDAASYVVKVERPGYQSPASQQVEIQKGGTARLTFALEPLPTSLTIHDALPGTQVSVDGNPAGEVRQDGRLTVSVSAGEHKIELAKQGYLPKHIERRFEAGQPVEMGRDDAQLAVDQKLVEEARQKEEQAAWGAVDKNNPGALQQFLTRYPSSKFAPEAKAQIAKLAQAAQQGAEEQRQQQLRLENEQRQAEQAEEEKRKAAAAALAKQQQAEAAKQAVNSDREAILAMIGRYAAAYDKGDANAVRDVFPRVPFRDVQQSFKNFRYEVTLTPSEPQISGDTAVLKCGRSLVATDSRGRHPTRDTIVFHLRKRGGQWLIESIQ